MVDVRVYYKITTDIYYRKDFCFSESDDLVEFLTNLYKKITSNTINDLQVGLNDYMEKYMSERLG